MGGGGSSEAVKVAKTAAATSFEDENVKNTGDNIRRRLAANSRDKSRSFWTAMITNSGANGKTTLG